MKGTRANHWILPLAGLAAVAVAVWLFARPSARPACLGGLARPSSTRLVQSTKRVGSETGGEPQLEIRYVDGTHLRVALSPRRIVSALPGITELVVHLGGLERLVAVSEYCDYPRALLDRGLPQVCVQPFSPEGVLAVEPDLLIVDRRLHRRDLEVIRRRVPHVLLLETSRSLAQLGESIGLLAQVLATPEALQRAAAWRERMAGIVARIEAGRPETPPRVLVVAQWDPLYVVGRGSLLDDCLRICGCTNVACDLAGDASGTFSEELVLARRPDWILTPDKPMPARLAARWRNVPAVAQGRLADGSADELVRGGPRILLGLDQLAQALRSKGAP